MSISLKGAAMNQDKQDHRKRGFRYSKESERTFFFYATIVMLIVWICLRIWGD